MFEEEPLTLAHPDVQAAKQKFEEMARDGRSKLNLIFEELFEYFKAGCITFESIAQEAGVTVQRVHQIYDQYFRELFARTGTERRKSCTFERLQVRLKASELELFEKDPVIKEIVGQAKEAGCTVEAITGPDGCHREGRVLIKALLLNGHRCKVQHASGVWRSRGSIRCYAHIPVSSSKMGSFETLLIRTAVPGYVERIFVLPITDLYQASVLRTSVKNTSLYLPLERLPAYKNHRQRIDYWQYENAWHLLPPPPKPPTS